MERAGFSQAEVSFMRRALRLARRGEGRVEPNPMVGCVLVRGGRVVGEGWHRRFGGPHAEVEALRAAGGAARGATAFVTLEPCCTLGKTPPCTDALIDAGVRKVVSAVRDPSPRVNGRGLRALAAAGILVEEGLLAGQAAALTAPFRKLVTRGRPWVILKWAQSVDGKIATRRGEARWISDEPARRHAHRTRARVDAILVGVGTVVADDPALSCRLAAARRVAARIVLDSRLRTPTTAMLVSTARRIPTIIFCGRRAPHARAARLARRGVEVVRASSRGAGVSLEAVLDELGARSMTNVLVEGGGAVLGSFVDRRLADEVHVYVAPRLIGGRDAPGPLHARGPDRLAGAARLRDATFRRLGGGWLLEARL